MRISRRIALFWAAAFIALAAASIRWPESTFAMWPSYPIVIGLIAGPLSSIVPTRLIHRAGLKRASAEIFILGLPLLFKKGVAPDVDFSVQFVVSGAEPGSYYVEMREGRCISGQGDLKEPRLTIYCGTDSWTLVSRGELSSERAIDEGLLRIRGSAQEFSRFMQCFALPGAHAAAPIAYAVSTSPVPTKTHR